MINLNVKTIFTKIDVQRKVAETIENSYEDLMLLAEREVKVLTPVDTGRLRAGMIGQKTGYMKGELTNEVEYAPILEYGTGKRAPVAMIRKGMASMKDKGTEFLKNKLSNL